VIRRVSDAALAVLGSMEVNGYVATITAGQLPRDLYLEVNKALDALGGKWSRKHKGHLFEDDPRDAIDRVVLTGAFTDAKQEYQFFETPMRVVYKLAELARLEATNPPMRILEPSAGRGAIADELSRWAGTVLTLVEKMPENRRALEAKGYVLEPEPDFLKYHGGPFERIVMNPPFSRQQDIDHVTHALSMLAWGGRLVAVMSAGVRFRQNRKARDFHALLEEFDTEFIELGDGAFKASGTMVKAVVLVAVRS
jgi:hypothetical protein